MNHLYYIYTAPNGEKLKVTSYKEVQALVEKRGGHYRTVCEPVYEAPNLYGGYARAKAVKKK